VSWQLLPEYFASWRRENQTLFSLQLHLTADCHAPFFSTEFSLGCNNLTLNQTHYELLITEGEYMLGRILGYVVVSLFPLMLVSAIVYFVYWCITPSDKLKQLAKEKADILSSNLLTPIEEEFLRSQALGYKEWGNIGLVVVALAINLASAILNVHDLPPRDPSVEYDWTRRAVFYVELGFVCVWLIMAAPAFLSGGLVVASNFIMMASTWSLLRYLPAIETAKQFGSILRGFWRHGGIERILSIPSLCSVCLYFFLAFGVFIVKVRFQLGFIWTEPISNWDFFIYIRLFAFLNSIVVAGCLIGPSELRLPLVLGVNPSIPTYLTQTTRYWACVNHTIKETHGKWKGLLLCLSFDDDKKLDLFLSRKSQVKSGDLELPVSSDQD